MLLNDDAVVEDGWLDALIAAAEARPQAGRHRVARPVPERRRAGRRRADSARTACPSVVGRGLAADEHGGVDAARASTTPRAAPCSSAARRGTPSAGWTSSSTRRTSRTSTCASACASPAGSRGSSRRADGAPRRVGQHRPGAEGAGVGPEQGALPGPLGTGRAHRRRRASSRRRADLLEGEVRFPRAGRGSARGAARPDGAAARRPTRFDLGQLKADHLGALEVLEQERAHGAWLAGVLESEQRQGRRRRGRVGGDPRRRRVPAAAARRARTSPAVRRLRAALHRLTRPMKVRASNLRPPCRRRRHRRHQRPHPRPLPQVPRLHRQGRRGARRTRTTRVEASCSTSASVPPPTCRPPCCAVPPAPRRARRAPPGRSCSTSAPTATTPPRPWPRAPSSAPTGTTSGARSRRSGGWPTSSWSPARRPPSPPAPGPPRRRASPATSSTSPAGRSPPPVLAERAVAMAESAGLTCKVHDEKALRKLGFGGLLDRQPGLDAAAPLRRARPTRAATAPTVALVGKGITFDAGGLSIKTAEGMAAMKCDMGGAAADHRRAVRRRRPRRRARGARRTCR